MVGTIENQHLFRKSYPRGLALFFYGVLWIAASLAGFIWLDSLYSASLVAATWAAALGGGLGGATGMLSRLQQHIAIKQDFQDQSFFSYLIQPFVGIVAGVVVMALVSIPIALIINYAISREILFTEILASSSFAAIQIVLAWTAGFYQRRGLDKIKFLTGRKTESKVLTEGVALNILDENSPLFYKALFRYQKRMRHWSYTWGMFLFVYAIMWLVGLLTAFMETGGIVESMVPQSNTAATSLVLAAWPAAAAGGLGGVCGLLYDLYRHVSIAQDFHRQHVMSYLVQPLIGCVFGLVIYLLLASGYLVLTTERGSTEVVDSVAVIMVQMMLGWIAGFRQQYIINWTQQLIQRIVSLVKSIMAVAYPGNWFNKASRDQALTELGEQTELFRLPEAEVPDSADRKWWQFD
jgi:hypothetical protein